MSSVSGIDSSKLVNTLIDSLNNSDSSNSSAKSETSSTDSTKADADSTTADTLSLIDQLKISYLKNQSDMVTLLFNPADNSTSANSMNDPLVNPDDSGSSDSLVSILNSAAQSKIYSSIADNTDLADLLTALNLASSSSSSNPLESLLQSLQSSGLSLSNSEAALTALKELLSASGNTDNSTIQEILNKYLPGATGETSQIKTTV